MSSDLAYSNALARRDQLAKEISELENELEQRRRAASDVAKFMEDWLRYAGLTDAPENGSTSEVVFVEPHQRKKERAQNPPKEQIGDIVEEFLREAKRPASRQRLFAVLEENQVFLQGSDPQMILSTMLWRMPQRFVRLRGLGYWLADEPYEPANYIPEYNSSVESERKDGKWISEVRNIINELHKEVFSLEDVYLYEKKLQMKFPDNLHIKDKIRQQLQILRDHNEIQFIDRGCYKLLSK